MMLNKFPANVPKPDGNGRPSQRSRKSAIAKALSMGIGVRIRGGVSVRYSNIRSPLVIFFAMADFGDGGPLR